MTEQTGPTLAAKKRLLSEYLTTLVQVQRATEGTPWTFTDGWWESLIAEVKALEGEKQEGATG